MHHTAPPPSVRCTLPFSLALFAMLGAVLLVARPRSLLTPDGRMRALGASDLRERSIFAGPVAAFCVAVTAALLPLVAELAEPRVAGVRFGGVELGGGLDGFS